MIIVITSCSARKDDSVGISSSCKTVIPSEYLVNADLISRLHDLRERTLNDPKAQAGSKMTYTFDLYVRAGKTYKDLRESGNQQNIKRLLLSSDEVQWFFLSGAYGIVHALEAIKRYQATFDKNIAYQKKIPFTGNIWKEALPKICDAIILKFQPSWVYVLGSREYTDFIKRTEFWKTHDNIRIFESTGSSGPSWLSPILNGLVTAILSDGLSAFNKEHSKFTKQQGN
jgi:hypothetical protein